MPPCQDHAKESGVAAVVNGIWITGRRRGHPGAIAYVEKRKQDYEEAMKAQRDCKEQCQMGAVNTAVWISTS